MNSDSTIMIKHALLHSLIGNGYNSDVTIWTTDEVNDSYSPHDDICISVLRC